MVRTTANLPATIAGDQAFTIAHADALMAYRDLSAYRIPLVRGADGWHIDYELADRRLKGGVWKAPRLGLEPRT